jgi:hypothetical protein
VIWENVERVRRENLRERREFEMVRERMEREVRRLKES